MANEAYNSETPTRHRSSRSELSAQFDRSISSVRNYTSRFENDIARPSLSYVGNSFKTQPILATFLAIAAALSFFPILIFIIASAIILISFVSFALFLSFSASFATILGFLSILVSTLVASFFIAGVVTDIGFFVYLSVRLFLLLRDKGFSDGSLAWIGEVWDYIIDFVDFVHKIVPIRVSRYITSPEANNEYAVVQQPASERSLDDSDYDVKLKGQ